MQEFLRPLFRPPLRTVFRCLPDVTASTVLENELRLRIDQSDHFIVLASAESCTSPEMEMEAQHWFSRPRDGEVLIIVTSGESKGWKEIRQRAVPPAI